MFDTATIDRTVEFHGHLCPGLAIGIRAAEPALDEIGANTAERAVVAIVESDLCCVDAIQFLTGCTFGKGNLIHRDHGKVAFTFLRRSDGRAIRISMRPGAMGKDDPEHRALFAKVKGQAATEAERRRFWADHEQRAERILAAPFDELYEVREVALEPPPHGRSMLLVECARCGEPTLQARIGRLGQRELCSPCLEREAAGEQAGEAAVAGSERLPDVPGARTEADGGDAEAPQHGCASADLSFLAWPGSLADWRMLLAYEAAVEAGVLAALPATPAELAARLRLDERALRSLLAGLAVWSIVERDERGRYATAPGAPGPADDAVLRQHAAVIGRWSALLADRLGGGSASSQRLASGAPPDVLQRFLAANALRLTSPVLDACIGRFPRSRRVLDLGGGHGEYSLELVRRGLRPVMQDLPDVVEIADRGNRLSDAGVQLFAADFHETLAPGPFDLVLCAGVSHTFDEQRNRDLYRRLHAITAPGGAIAIVTFLRDRNPVASIFALQMLVATQDGDTHGETDYRRWLGEAGYGALQLHDLEGRPQTVVLAQR